MRDEILKEIEAFLKDTGMSPTAFGEKAMRDRTLMISLRAGRNMTIRTLEKLQRFMADERGKVKRKPRPTRLRAEVAA